MGHSKYASKIGRGTVIIILGFAFGTFAQYLYKAILARTLGPESFGIFIQGLAVTQALAIIALLGMRASIPRYISFYRGKDKPEMMDKTISTGTILVFFTSLALSASMFALSDFIAMEIFKEPALTSILKIYSLTIPSFALVHLTMGFFRGQQNAVKKILIDDFVWSGLIVLFVAISVYLEAGVSGAVAAYLLATFLAMITSFYIYRTDYSPSFHIRDLNTSELIKFSWPLFLVSILMILNRWFDVMMLGYFKTSAQSGIYEVAYSISGYVGMMLTAVSFLFLPVLAELHAKKKIEEIREVYTTATRWMITFAIPALAGILVFPEQVIQILFGGQYISGSLPMIILGFGFFTKILKGPSENLLISIGRTKKFLLGEGVTSVLIVSLNYLLIPDYGMVGAAVSTLFAFAAGNLVLLLLVRKEISTLPYDRNLLPAIASGAIFLPLLYLSKLLFSPGMVLAAILGISLTGVYIYILHFLNGFTEDDLEMMREMISDTE